VKIDSTSFERVEQFKYLGTTLTNQKSIQEKFKKKILLRECLLSFSGESYVLQFSTKKYKN